MLAQIAAFLCLCVHAAAVLEINHLHLALSSDPSRMYVQWTTSSSASSENTVSWGSSASKLSQTASGESWTFTDNDGREYFFHKATMRALAPGSTVYYTVGGPTNTSSVHSFVATRTDFSSEDPLKIAWIGDLGFANAQADEYLAAEVQNGVYDHVIHVGDYAYDMNSGGGTNGDNFESMIEPITSSVSYHGCV